MWDDRARDERERLKREPDDFGMRDPGMMMMEGCSETHSDCFSSDGSVVDGVDGGRIAICSGCAQLIFFVDVSITYILLSKHFSEATSCEHARKTK